MLLTGDLEAAGEAHLLKSYQGPATVLKAPHHGSRTSSGTALLDRVRPEHVIFTVGRNNRHGLPHPAITARYAQRGIRSWRTDRDGRVRVDMGSPLTVSAFRSTGR